MIHFVVTEEGSYSIRWYLAEEGAALADRMQIVLYEDLPRMGRLPLGTWVLTELDRLDAHQRELARIVAGRLRAAGNGVRLLNDPERVRLRLDLLRAARASDAIDYRAWPVHDLLFDAQPATPTADSRAIPATSLRYPVFVRFGNQHIGNLTPLLDSPKSLAAGLGELAATGVPRDDLIVVEFCETAGGDGIYRKYAAYNMDGRIIAKALEQSLEWMVKWKYRIFDRVRADEEIEYCRTNPHEAWIREMFALARIDYGRIDYGLVNGRPVLWEINTNPTIGRGPERADPQTDAVVAYKEMIAPARTEFHAAFEEAWSALDTPTPADAGIELSVPDDLVRAIERGAKQRRNAERRSALVNVVARQFWVRPVTRAVKWALTPIMAARVRAESRRI